MEGYRVGLLYGGIQEELEELQTSVVQGYKEALAAAGHQVVELPFSVEESWPDASWLRQADVLVPITGAVGFAPWRLFGLANMAGVPYVGPDWQAAALHADRLRVRKLLAQDQLPLGLFRSFSQAQWEEDEGYCQMEAEISLGYPCRVRAASGPGSMQGESVMSREELAAAAAGVLESHGTVLVEEEPKGEGFSVAVLGGAAVKRLSTSGYKSEGESLLIKSCGIPTIERMDLSVMELSESEAEEVRRLVERFCSAVDVDGPALLYLSKLKDGGNILLVDWDLAPDWRPGSVYAQLWGRQGVSWEVLKQRLLEQGLVGTVRGK